MKYNLMISLRARVSLDKIRKTIYEHETGRSDNHWYYHRAPIRALLTLNQPTTEQFIDKRPDWLKASGKLTPHNRMIKTGTTLTSKEVLAILDWVQELDPPITLQRMNHAGQPTKQTIASLLGAFLDARAIGYIRKELNNYEHTTNHRDL